MKRRSTETEVLGGSKTKSGCFFELLGSEEWETRTAIGLWGKTKAINDGDIKIKEIVIIFYKEK